MLSEIFRLSVTEIVFQMCILKFKYVLTNLVIQSLFLNCQSVKRARRYYNFDYDFRDWDNATQIELDYTLDLNVDGYNETNSWNLPITENTEHTEDTTPGILVDSKENTTNAVETITNQTESNGHINVTVNPQPTNVTVNPQSTNVTVTTVDPLNREPVNVTTGDPLQGPEVTADQIGNASISTPTIMTFPDIYETRSQSTRDIFLETDIAHHSTLPTPKSGIILEAHEEMTAKHTGYLTTFLLEVFKVMAAKNTTDAAKLFAALEAEVTELDKADRFHGFGKSTIAAFIMLVKLIKGVESDVVQKQAARGHYLLGNRTVNLPGEVVIVMDLADDVYQYEEGERILATLEDIDKFPNTVKSDREIAHEVMEAVVLAPFMRIYGSAQEKFLVKKLEQAIVKDFFHGVTFDRNQNDSVSQNVLISQQIFLNNQFIGIDVLHRNGRRYYNFDNEDKEDASNFDYNEELNKNDGPFRKQDGKPWNPLNNASTVPTKTETTPMIFVTIPTNPSSITSPHSPASTISANNTLPVSSQTFPRLNSKTSNVTFNVSISKASSFSVGISTSPGVDTISPGINSSTTSVIATLTSPFVSISDMNFTQTTPAVAEETQNTSLPITVTDSITSSAVSIGSLNEGTGEMPGSETTTSQYDMTFPYSETTPAVPSDQSTKIIDQAYRDMRQFEAGYFTIFLLESTRIFAAKEHQDATRLLQALETEVMALLATNKLSGFGKSTRSAFVYLVQTLNNLPIETVQYEANVGSYLLMDRRQTFGREIVNLIDEVDKVIEEDEGRRILQVLVDLDNYPRANKTAQQVVHEMMDAVVEAPFVRMYGTPLEAAMVRQLEDLVVTMVFSGYSIQRRGFGDVRSNTPQYYSIFQRHANPTQITKVKKYMNKRKERIFKTLSSKYTTIGTRKKLRTKEKRRYTMNKNKTKHNRPKRPKEIATNLLKSDLIVFQIPDFKRTKIKKVRTQLQSTITNISTKRKQKNLITHKKVHNKKKDKTPLKRFKLVKRKKIEKDLRTRLKSSKIEKESSFTDEEKKLIANLDDAFFHGNDEPEFRNREVESKNNLESSFSNEEAILKSKIYKEFGYENDFAEAIKRRHEYKV